MLRDCRFRDKSYMGRKNCVEKIDDQTQPKGKDEPGDPDTSLFKPSKCCRFP